jgi:hypothetical protein
MHVGGVEGGWAAKGSGCGVLAIASGAPCPPSSASGLLRLGPELHSVSISSMHSLSHRTHPSSSIRVRQPLGRGVLLHRLDDGVRHGCFALRVIAPIKRGAKQDVGREVETKNGRVLRDLRCANRCKSFSRGAASTPARAEPHLTESCWPIMSVGWSSHPPPAHRPPARPCFRRRFNVVRVNCLYLCALSHYHSRSDNMYGSFCTQPQVPSW